MKCVFEEKVVLTIKVELVLPDRGAAGADLGLVSTWTLSLLSACAISRFNTIVIYNHHLHKLSLRFVPILYRTGSVVF